MQAACGSLPHWWSVRIRLARFGPPYKERLFEVMASRSWSARTRNQEPEQSGLVQDMLSVGTSFFAKR